MSKSARWADEVFIREKVAEQAHGAANGVVPAAALAHGIDLASIWTILKDRYDARERSVEVYRRQTERFVKWAAERGVAYAGEVTREMAEDYARWLYARVTTADKHVGCLRREWRLLFPDSPVNPWNLSIRLQKKEKERAMNYRVLSLNEIRRIRQAMVLLKEDASSLGSRGRGLEAGLLADMSDAVVLCYHYGFRIGSLDAVFWEDIDLALGKLRHRPPKTSRATLGDEYPVVPEVGHILERRRAAAGRCPRGPVFPLFARAHTTSEQSLNLAIKAIFKFAGVRDSALKGRASWHSLRATFITRLTENGCPAAIVKELAQHVKTDMTQRYVHTSLATKLKWLRTLPDLGEVDPAAEYLTERELP